MDKKKVYRLIDANVNRAREGLRVVEDTARFIWNDTGLYRQLRSLRHRVSRTAHRMYPALMSVRDAAADVGKKAKTSKSSSILLLARVNCYRAQEALRVLEEYARIIDTVLAPLFQSIRFDLYRIEQIIFKKYGKKT